MIQIVDPVLGKVGLDSYCVETAREAWIQLIADEYFKLLKEGVNWRRFDKDLDRFNQPGITLFKFSFQMTHYSANQILVKFNAIHNFFTNWRMSVPLLLKAF
jgi:hypothetical protein